LSSPGGDEPSRIRLSIARRSKAASADQFRERICIAEPLLSIEVASHLVPETNGTKVIPPSPSRVWQRWISLNIKIRRFYSIYQFMLKKVAQHARSTLGW